MTAHDMADVAFDWDFAVIFDAFWGLFGCVRQPGGLGTVFLVAFCQLTPSIFRVGVGVGDLLAAEPGFFL